jgi:effector-binding domain-containing protein
MSTVTTIRPEMRDLEEQLVAVIPVTTTVKDIPNALGEAYQELDAALKAAGLEWGGPPFTRYLSFGPEISLEAGCPISRAFPTSGRVAIARLPAGQAATAMHLGPYDTISTTYDTLMAWMESEGHAPAGPMWEVYLTDPDMEPDPQKWQTEVFIPVR